MSAIAPITEWCEWCVADAGRTHATRPCCVVRRASKLHGYGIVDAIRDVRSEHGAEAGEQFRLNVYQAMAMRLARAPKAIRVATYALVAGKDDLELVKRLTMVEYEKQAAKA